MARRAEAVTHPEGNTDDNVRVPISDRRFSPSELQQRDIVRRAIGEVIARRRKSAGLTQVEVAHRANMSERELRRIEKGLGGTPLDRLWPLAKALNCTPAELVLEAQEGSRGGFEEAESHPDSDS